MTIDEAIHCMKSYLPESTPEDCTNCKYYGSKQIDEQVYVCESSEAHRMAIVALELMKTQGNTQEQIDKFKEELRRIQTNMGHELHRIFFENDVQCQSEEERDLT